MEIENSKFDNLKSSRGENLIKKFDDLPELNFNEKDDKKKKTLQRTENQLTIYLDLCKQGKSLIRNLEKKRDFPNPDQLNELIKDFDINPHDTNFSDLVFDPYETEKSLKAYNEEKTKRKPPSILSKNASKSSSNYPGSYSQAQHIKQSLWDSHQKTIPTHSDVIRAYADAKR